MYKKLLWMVLCLGPNLSAEVSQLQDAIIESDFRRVEMELGALADDIRPSCFLVEGADFCNQAPKILKLLEFLIQKIDVRSCKKCLDDINKIFRLQCDYYMQRYSVNDKTRGVLSLIYEDVCNQGIPIALAMTKLIIEAFGVKAERISSEDKVIRLHEMFDQNKGLLFACVRSRGVQVQDIEIFVNEFQQVMIKLCVPLTWGSWLKLHAWKFVAAGVLVAVIVAVLYYKRSSKKQQHILNPGPHVEVVVEPVRVAVEKEKVPIWTPPVWNCVVPEVKPVDKPHEIVQVDIENREEHKPGQGGLDIIVSPIGATLNESDDQDSSDDSDSDTSDSDDDQASDEGYREPNRSVVLSDVSTMRLEWILKKPARLKNMSTDMLSRIANMKLVGVKFAQINLDVKRILQERVVVKA